MAERFDLDLDFDEILSRNPRINQDQLEQARAMLRRLREHGLQRKGYDLAPPFGRYRVSVQDNARGEPRLIRPSRSYCTEAE